MTTTIIIAAIVLLGLYMAWNVGANDVANSMADAVGSKALSVKKAILVAGVFEFAGAVLVGAHVTDTVRKGIVDPSAIMNAAGVGETQAAALMVLGMLAALLAAALWLHLASLFGMPVSTTHSIVGAITGFGITAAGLASVHWGKMAQIVASWVLSPIAGGIVSFILFRLTTRFILGTKRPAEAAVRWTPVVVFVTFGVVTLITAYKGLKHISASLTWISGWRAFAVAGVVGLAGAVAARILARRRLAGKGDLEIAEQLEEVEKVFAPLVVITSASVAFAHGANDVANAVGPMAAVVDILSSGSVKMKVTVPAWILMAGGGGIVLGLATFGYRVMRTVGEKITVLSPSRGVAADIAASCAVLVCSRLKLPVSTTHTLVGAIIGVGLARGLGAVDKKVTGDIMKAWFITVPVAAVIAAVLFLVLKLTIFTQVVNMLQGAPGAG